MDSKTLVRGLAAATGQTVATDRPRPLYAIAREIRRDWQRPYFGAVPYIEALGSLNRIEDNYFEDSGKSIVAYFLANAQTWRGEVARRVKAELKALL